MKILLLEGPGRRPAAYPGVLARALEKLGHRVQRRVIDEAPATWSGRRQARRTAGVMVSRFRPDVVHVLCEDPATAEAFAGHGAPVLHTTSNRPSRTDWVIAPSRAALDQIAGAGEGLDYRVGVLPYAVELAEASGGCGSYALVRIAPDDAEAAHWVQEAAFRVPTLPLHDEGEMGDARFVVSVASRPAPWPEGVAEAMAAGLPVIATWGGAAPELVGEGVSGFLSAPGDIDSLVSHMNYLWDHPEEARRMGQEARNEAEGLFGVEAHVKTLMRWYLRAGAARLAV